MTAFAKLACIAIIILLGGLYVYAWAQGDTLKQCLHTWEVAWGLYVWADAYAGFILMATFVYAYERRLGVTALIFLAACGTGNWAYAAWLLWRGPDLYNRISKVQFK